MNNPSTPVEQASWETSLHWGCRRRQLGLVYCVEQFQSLNFSFIY